MRIAVVIPCHRVQKQVLGVIDAIGPEVAQIYVVDDACPQQSGKYVEESCADPRVHVLHHAENRGVGGAVLTGYRRALEDGAEIIVKLDGDGQLDPSLIPRFVAPIAQGEADYTKGNRFFSIEGLRQMPRMRLWGNAALSFVAKLSSGYWDLFDPNNGYTAIHASVAALLPFDKISRRYFFESDLLFRLNTIRAVVQEIPMDARYGDEESGVRPLSAAFEFAWKHARNSFKRVFYNYFLRGFSIASVNLVVGLGLVAFGLWAGITSWAAASRVGEFASSGQVMLAALPILVGVQLLLAFLSYDMSNAPRTPLHRRLRPLS